MPRDAVNSWRLLFQSSPAPSVGAVSSSAPNSRRMTSRATVAAVLQIDCPEQ